jgi:hypothetical protein
MVSKMTCTWCLTRAAKPIRSHRRGRTQLGRGGKILEDKYNYGFDDDALEWVITMAWNHRGFK